MGIDTANLRTAEEIRDTIRSLSPRGLQTLLVAIDGCGGSGKSTLARFLSKELGATVVQVDDFARADVAGWDMQRFRHQVLVPLLVNRAARYQQYDWNSQALAQWHDIPMGGVVIVEGVSSTRRELGDVWDLAIWVECPRDLRLKRGLERDGERVLSQWVDVWMVEEDEYVVRQSPRERADVVFDGSQGRFGTV